MTAPSGSARSSSWTPRRTGGWYKGGPTLTPAGRTSGSPSPGDTCRCERRGFEGSGTARVPPLARYPARPPHSRGARGRAMTTRRPGRRDPLETAIEIALQPGSFIAYRAGSDFVSSLEEVAGQIEALGCTDARRAVGLFETFLAGCYEKAEELDDSSGSFSMFVVSL